MSRIISRFAVVTAVSLFALGAHASNSNGCQGNCPGGDTINNTTNAPHGGNAYAGAAAAAVGVGVGLGGAGGAGGQGGDAKAYGGAGGSVLGSGNSSVKNDNTNLNANMQGQGQKQGQQQGQGQQQSASSDQSQSNRSTNTNKAEGGAASAAGGQGSGNSTSIDIAAPVIPKPAANSAYVGDLPQLPQGSCRLFIGGGGTTRDGSATGMLPIGNDQTCLSTRSLEVMKQINASVGQVVFGKADMLDVACKIEGMDKLKACAK